MICLRPLKKMDCEALTAWFPEERQFAMWSVGRFQYPLTAEQLWDYMEELQEKAGAWSMAALNEAGELVGHFAVKDINYQEKSVHLGYIVVDPGQRGKGYGKEMVSQAVRYVSDILGMKRVTLNVIEGNDAAYACYRSLGFHEEMRIESGYSYENESWTLLCMARIAYMEIEQEK